MKRRELAVLIRSLFIIMLFIACEKDEKMQYPETDKFIQITEKIFVDNGVDVKDPVFNYNYYDNFLEHVSTSGRFLIVPLRDFKNTFSEEKVVLSLRYDIDDNINAAVKFAYRENKYGIRSTYFFLHTAKYYGKKVGKTFQRNENLIYYIKKIQNSFGHEIGFHNDLVTLQLMYEIPPREYLKNELEYLRGNDINLTGTTYHGSPYCLIYLYSNAYFWKDYPDSGWNYEYISKGFKTIKIDKDYMSNYGLEYEGNLLNPDYFFADAYFVDGKRWNMSMINIDTIKPGKKVIILLHPEHWN
jgi:hypothetical protein